MDEQVTYIVKWAAKNIYLIRILQSYLPKHGLATIYKSIVLTILIYGSALYVNLLLHLSENTKKLGKRMHPISSGCKFDLIKSPLNVWRENAINQQRSRPQIVHINSPNTPNNNKKFNQLLCVSERKKKCFIPLITEVINM